MLMSARAYIQWEATDGLSVVEYSRFFELLDLKFNFPYVSTVNSVHGIDFGWKMWWNGIIYVDNQDNIADQHLCALHGKIESHIYTCIVKLLVQNATEKE